jgi:hypothetical protein
MLKENLILEMMQLWKSKIAGMKALSADPWAQTCVSTPIMKKGKKTVTCDVIDAGNFI